MINDAISVLESNATGAVAEEAIGILDGAYAGAVAREAKTAARLFFMRAVETAARGSDDALALELFGYFWPEQASKLRAAPELALRAVTNWRADHQKWSALHAAIATFEQDCPAPDRLSRMWRGEGGPTYAED
jgi:hypothetical protein